MVSIFGECARKREERTKAQHYNTLHLPSLRVLDRESVAGRICLYIYWPIEIRNLRFKSTI